MTFATKPIWHYPNHHRHVATLHWEIKSSKFLQIWKRTQKIAVLIASNFVIHPSILIFSVFKIASFSPHWLQIKFSMSLLFYLFAFAISLWHWKFITADVTAAFVNNEHGIQRRGQDFDKKGLYLKEYTANRFTDECPEKSWTKHGANKLLKKLQDSGTVDTRARQRQTAQWKENSYTFVCLIFQIFC